MLKAAIEISAEIGASHLVMHTGMVRDPHDDIEVAYSRQRDALHRAGDIAAGLGVTLCVENVFRFGGTRETATPSKLAGELEAIDHKAVKATLDFSHAYIRCAENRLDPLAEIAALAPHAVHLHLHDSFGRPTEMWTFDPAEAVAFGEGDLHLPIGWGAIDWDALVKACHFPPETIAIMELNPRHWRELRRPDPGSRGAGRALQRGLGAAGLTSRRPKLVAEPAADAALRMACSLRLRRDEVAALRGCECLAASVGCPYIRRERRE